MGRQLVGENVLATGLSVVILCTNRGSACSAFTHSSPRADWCGGLGVVATVGAEGTFQLAAALAGVSDCSDVAVKDLAPKGVPVDEWPVGTAKSHRRAVAAAAQVRESVNVGWNQAREDIADADVFGASRAF